MNGLRKLGLVAGLLTLCACMSHSGDSMGTADKKVDCSAVRCAACPTGQHPALTPPDCCRCVPD